MNYKQKISNTLALALILSVVLVLTMLVLMPITSSAQSSANTEIYVTSSNLRSGEVFSVGLNSTDINLSQSQIDWYINGILGLSGIGKEGFTSYTGPVGTTLSIRAVITPKDGRSIVKAIQIRPQEIDFLWRANTYTPPLYKGRSLASSGSYVSITAMPNVSDPDGNILDPKNLKYTWSQNGILLGNASGIGKQTVILENPQKKEQPFQVQLKVQSLDGSLSTQDSLTIPFSEPKILLYENRPLLGIGYGKAINTYVLDSNEVTLRAEPYFFSTDDVYSDRLSYKWKLSGNRISNENLKNQNEIVLRADGEDGEIDLEVEVLNDNLPFRIFQKAIERIKIKL